LKPPNKNIPFFNILCFGVAGSGKSSFINSLLTALGTQISAPAAVGGSTDHVTKDITRFQVSQIKGLEDVKINFFDIWGLDSNNFQGSMFLDVLTGKLPPDYKMKERTTFTEKMAETSWQAHERRIHSVLFFMPFSVVDNPKIVNVLSRNFSICTTEYHMNPVVIVTRAAQAGGIAEQEEVKKIIADKFNIPAGNMYMFDNYTSEKAKTMCIDKKTLEILMKAIESCQTYQTFFIDQLIKDLKKSNCGRCQFEVEIDFSVCPQCGFDLAPPPVFAPNCVKCNFALKDNFKICPKCKTVRQPISNKPTTCPKCHDAVESDWAACASCGADL